MTKTEASTVLLINSCPIMALGRRQRAANQTSPFLSIPFCFVASPPLMNSLLGANYFRGCIRNPAGPMETSAAFPSILAAPLCPSAGDGSHLIEF